MVLKGFPDDSNSKKSTCNAGRPGFDPWVGKIPRSREWQPTPVCLPGESPWTEEPGGLQSIGSQRVRHDWVTKHMGLNHRQLLEYHKISYPFPDQREDQKEKWKWNDLSVALLFYNIFINLSLVIQDNFVMYERKKNSVLKLYVTYEFGVIKYILGLFTLWLENTVYQWREERANLGTSYSLSFSCIL